MFLYTSSAGRSGMLVLARVKNAIFSLESHERSQRSPGGQRQQVSETLPPEGLHLGDLFATLASDLVDVLGCCPHHLLHPFLLQLLLLGLMSREEMMNWPRESRSPVCAQTAVHLFLSLL